MAELSYDELDGYVRQICAAKKLIYVEDGIGNKKPLMFHYPSMDDVYIADVIHDTALQEATELGLPSIEEMEGTIRSRGIYTDADDEEVARLRSKLDGQRAILAKTTRVPARRNRLVGIIADIEKQIEEILFKKELHLELTRERKATEQRFLYLTQRGVRDLEGRLVWESRELFDQEKDAVFRKRAFVEYIIFSYGLGQPIIRAIARSNIWRIRYITATKTGDALFDRPISHYTVDQLTLLYWSHYYQSIYEMMPDERPEDSIIEDDRALDAYMKDWQADKERDAAAAKAKKGSNHKNSAWDHGETLVMRSNPMYEDVQYSETLQEKGTAGKGSSLDVAPTDKKKQERARKGVGR